MNINQKEINIKNLLKGYSLETTPNVYKKYGKFAGLVPLQSSVYITYLPDENSANIVDTAKKLTDEGYDVIPHLPSRRMRDKEDLENYFVTPQKVSFKKLAAAYGIEYVNVKTLNELRGIISVLPSSGIRILEIKTNRKKDVRYLNDLNYLIANNL